MERTLKFVASVMEQMEKENFTQGEAAYVALTLQKDIEQSRRRIDDDAPFAAKKNHSSARR